MCCISIFLLKEQSNPSVNGQAGWETGGHGQSHSSEKQSLWDEKDLMQFGTECHENFNLVSSLQFTAFATLWSLEVRLPQQVVLITSSMVPVTIPVWLLSGKVGKEFHQWKYLSLL